MSRKVLLTYILIMAFSMSLIPYSIDPFLPAFPAMGEFYGVDHSTIQASFAGVTIGLAIGQLLSGPISDAFGRRPMLLIATFGYAVSTIAVFFAPTIESFTLLRFTMALFAATGDVVARAIVRDLFRGQPMADMLSKIFLIQALSPILGPLVGSQVAAAAPWQYAFLVFGFFGLLTAGLAFMFLVETLPVAQRRSQSAIGLLRGFRSVLRDRVYVGLLLVSALMISSVFGYLNIVSYLYQDHYGLSAAEFGGIFALNSIALYLGVQFGGFITKFVQARWMLLVYVAGGMVAGGYLILTAGTSVLVAEVGFIIMLFSFGAPASTVPTFALLNHGTEAGTAASLMGSANFVATSVYAIVYSQLSTTSTFDVGMLVLVNFAVAMVVMLAVVRPWSLPDLRKPQELAVGH
jgi:DHA1 family bicyclomycin/chloramphenicol resistance-like MFS transporter